MIHRRKRAAVLVHMIRVGTVAALLLLIPSPRRGRTIDGNDVAPPGIETITRCLPDADSVEPGQDANGFWVVHDAAGQSIARVARTLPEASDVIGYRGPSEAMILIDAQFNLLGVDLIQSSDTDEHVQAVEKDVAFFDQFRKWKWPGPRSGEKIDAVSGATLTSLALAKGVLKRMGGDRPSLVFPDAVDPNELHRWFPKVEQNRIENDLVVAIDSGRQPVGYAIRTGPLSDSVIGYQGPTELLIRVEPAAGPHEALSGPKILDVHIRSSFDNEPYVGYCKTESGFWGLFNGRTMQELAKMDLEAERVEGVSGATMSSMAIAETLVASARSFQARAEARGQSESQSESVWSRIRGWGQVGGPVRLAAADWGSVILLCCIPLFRLRGWFRNHRLRILWLIVVVGVIGFWSGNLVSMALVAGWSAEGIAWRLAPALAAIALVALVSPVVGKSNPYCNHLCPHGAVQQLVRPTVKSKRRWTPPPAVISVLRWLPGVLLVSAYLTLLRIPATDLSSWEPFHAYLLRIAPWTALAFAGVTIGFSSLVPMGYCRLGCPTGRLLDHLRRHARSDRIRWPDVVAMGLLLVAGLTRAGVL
jgi:Na+-translocating ferredoxin:NAD+ oxidoreductase RnfG subunit